MALSRIAWIGTALLIPLLSACSRKENALAAAHRNQDPASCARCHTPEFNSWKASHHALAETNLSPSDPAYPEPFSHPLRWLGVSPLKQLLIAADHGRIQVSDLAYDPVRKDWFNVFGSDIRQPGDWGHWTGRGMNWNSNCAACHNTDVAKNYRADTDSYATAIGHMGVTCAACHGPSSASFTRLQVEEACAACHARRGELTGQFHPGDKFADHYALTIADDSDTFYPDGQVKDEDFEYTAFMGSKMHAAGVSCTDCHNPHSGQLRAPGNTLCLTCHGGANKAFPTAPLIVPEVHSHHGSGSTGDLCINCHMPTTVYMQRHSRQDHGFTIPDPLLTLKTGEPNACNRCHADKDAAWADAATTHWFGDKMARPTRLRAFAIAAARSGETRTADGRDTEEALALEATGDPIPYWRAVASNLLGIGPANGAAESALGRAVKDSDPLVRAEAIKAWSALGGAANGTGASAAATFLLKDPVRSVRINAAWALRDQVDPSSRAGKDLNAFIAFNADQPTGIYRLGAYDLARNQIPEAADAFQKATLWDPLGPQFRAAYAVALSEAGKSAQAAAELRTACSLAPKDAHLRFQLGLALNEAGDLSGAAGALQSAADLDPSDPEVWYNLGVARMRQSDWPRAVDALRRAQTLDPGSQRAAQALSQAEAMLKPR